MKLHCTVPDRGGDSRCDSTDAGLIISGDLAPPLNTGEADFLKINVCIIYTCCARKAELT